MGWQILLHENCWSFDRLFSIRFLKPTLHSCPTLQLHKTRAVALQAARVQATLSDRALQVSLCLLRSSAPF